MTTRKYGWKPDLPDHRDHKFVTLHTPESLPAAIDLRPGCPPVYDQGQLGSCTANAIAGAIQFDEIKQRGHRPVMKPSRLFIYYNERDMEGTPNEDSGAYIRDGFKSIATTGICPDRYWPYLQEKVFVKPSVTAYTRAVVHKALSYRAVSQSLTDMKGCLAEGYPFVVGFSVYESFESPEVARTGIVPLPDPSEQQLGGHAVTVVGYDDSKGWWIVRNSWGTGWGDSGYFYMPYAYLTNPNLSDDFWTVTTVS